MDSFDGGGEKQVVELNDSVCFVPITNDGYYVFAKQYRESEEKVGIALYGGYVYDGECKEDTVLREMYKECNITNDKVFMCMKVWSDPMPSKGICTEKNSCYEVILNVTKDELDVKSNDVHEDIEPIFLTKEKAVDTLMTHGSGMKSYLYAKTIEGEIMRVKLGEGRRKSRELYECKKELKELKRRMVCLEEINSWLTVLEKNRADKK